MRASSDTSRRRSARQRRAEDAVREAARVLAVDLGLRTFAACSVFALRSEAPTRPGALAFKVPLGGRTLWAVHERSFHLELPGETPSRAGAHWRRSRDEEMRRMRRALSRYRRVMRLADKPPQDRGAALEALAEARVEGDPFPFEEAIHTALAARAEAPQPVWDEAVAAALREMRRADEPGRARLAPPRERGAGLSPCRQVDVVDPAPHRPPPHPPVVEPLGPRHGRGAAPGPCSAGRLCHPASGSTWTTSRTTGCRPAPT